MRFTIITFLSFFSIFLNIAYGAVHYVDGNLASNCTDGTYDVTSRTSGSGTDGNAYKTIYEAIGGIGCPAQDGDTIYIRGGTYSESKVDLWFKDTTDMTTIEAYNGETVTINDITPATNTFQIDHNAKAITIRGITFRSTRPDFPDYDGDATAIGTNGGGNGGLIIVDNCDIGEYPHCGIKGAFKWHIKNSYFHDIGGWSSQPSDRNDHGIYVGNTLSAGNEAIIEHNRFENITGGGINLYIDPKYYIVRYNIFDGNGGNSDYGIVLSGSNHKIYGNTIYDCWIGIMYFRAQCQDNEVKNNLLWGNTVDAGVDTAGKWTFPGLQTAIDHNYLGTAIVAEDNSLLVAIKVADESGYLVDETVTGSISGATGTVKAKSKSYNKIRVVETNANLFQVGETVTGTDSSHSQTIITVSFGEDYRTYDDNDIVNAACPFVTGSPLTWLEFRLSLSSLCINTGTNISSVHENVLDPNDTTWPPTTLDQNDYGSGWEIGAFVFREIGSKPAPVKWKDPPFE